MRPTFIQTLTPAAPRYIGFETPLLNKLEALFLKSMVIGLQSMYVLATCY